MGHPLRIENKTYEHLGTTMGNPEKIIGTPVKAYRVIQGPCEIFPRKTAA